MISIIIRTYNEEKYLKLALENIFDQDTLDSYEVIIVDSGSTDKTLEIASKYNTKIIHIPKEDFTFGRSLNLGCANANGEFLVFISAHCIPFNNEWLHHLVHAISKDEVALAYGRQIGNEVTKFSEHQVFSKYFPESLDDQQGGFFCNNACSVIKKSFWSQYQFNEDLTGLEDLDWAKHFHKQGYIISYVPVSIVYHIHEETWKKIKIRYEREALALKEIMPEIHFNFFDMIISIIKGINGDFKVAIKGKSWDRLLEICLFRFCQFYGAYKGNHSHRKVSKKRKEKYFYP